MNIMKLWKTEFLQKSNHSGQTHAYLISSTCFPSLLFFLSSSFILSLQRSIHRCCRHQPPPVEPGLRDHPIGLSSREGRARLLRHVGPDGGDGSHFPSPATPQSHVPQQLRRRPQPRTQGTTVCSRSVNEHVPDRNGATSPEHFVFVLQVLDTVSLPSDLPSLSVAPWLSATERRRVTTIARLLNQLPTESSAVITSADTMLTELFSHRGETFTHVHAYAKGLF